MIKILSNAVILTYSLLLCNSLRMKSLAWSDTFANASTSKSQSQALTFFNVSKSSSPANGDNPLNLASLKKENVILNYIHKNYELIVALSTQQKVSSKEENSNFCSVFLSLRINFT